MLYALLVTNDDILAAQFQKMTAVTQSELLVVDAITSELLVGAYRVFVDQSSEIVPFSHQHVVILAPENVSSRTWELALKLNAQHVEVLPSQTDWILEHLVPPAQTRAHVVGITPVVGGAGASTVACALAAQYVQQGLKVCLVDADPVGGGLDVLLGSEHAPGMRWSDISALHGSVSSEELFNSLVVSNGIHVVAHKRGQFDLSTNQIQALIESVASACDVVLVDTPRLAEEFAQQVFENCDDLLLVMPTTVQASSLVTSMRTYLDGKQCGLVIRQIPGSGLTAVGVAQAVELPLRASLPTDARIVEQVEQGLGLGHVTMGTFSRSIKQLSSTIEREDENGIAA
jgi:secretion/DNA translocation related CpaE-like protein